MSVIEFLLVAWALASLALLAFVLGRVALERRRSRHRIAERLDAVGRPRVPEMYPRCIECEGAAGVGRGTLIAHQARAHGAIRW